MRRAIFPIALLLLLTPGMAWPEDVNAELLENVLPSNAVDAACVVNAGEKSDRETVNALIWKEASSWKAIVFRVASPASFNSRSPCWSGVGICAVVDGDFGNFDAICTPANPGMIVEDNLKYLRPAAGSGLPAIAGAEGILDLARGLRAEDVTVTLLSNAKIWLNAGRPERLSARLETGVGEVRIGLAKGGLDAPLVDALDRLVTKFGHRDFDRVGKVGAVSGQSLYTFADDACQRIESVDGFWKRVAAANGVLFVDKVQTNSDDRLKVYYDVLQGILDGVVPSSMAPASLSQDPRLYIMEGAACP